MKAKLKELIDNAMPFQEGEYNDFLIIPSGKAYDGFWGKNGYDNIIVLGKKKLETEWVRIDVGSTDVFSLSLRNYIGGMHFDISHDLGCIRFVTDKALKIGPVASSIIANYGWDF